MKEVLELWLIIDHLVYHNKPSGSYWP